MIVELICLDEKVESGPLFFRDAPFTIGVASDAQLALADMEVSRTHCELYERDGALWVRDLDSVKGTFVNGTPVRESPLTSGDMLTLGRVRFRVFYGGDARERPAPRRPKRYVHSPCARRQPKHRLSLSAAERGN